MHSVLHRLGAFVHDPSGQARCDAVVHQFVFAVSPHHLRVTRQPRQLQAIGHAQMREEFGDGGQQQFLHRVGEGGKRWGAQHGRVCGARLLTQGTRHHQTAHAVTQNDQGLRAGFVVLDIGHNSR